MNKRGQMYLIAAIVIVGLIIGFATIFNYSKKNDFSKISELKDELNYESSKVLDYIEATGDDKIDNFTKTFDEYAEDKFEIYYVVGEEGSLKGYNYDESGTQIPLAVDETTEAGKALVKVNGTEYSFNVQEGKNFHFIILSYQGGEQYVETNQ